MHSLGGWPDAADIIKKDLSAQAERYSPEAGRDASVPKDLACTAPALAPAARASRQMLRTRRDGIDERDLAEYGGTIFWRIDDYLAVPGVTCMLCPQCGRPVPEGATLCPTCGRQTAPTQYSVGGLEPMAPSPVSGPVTPEKTSGLAIASLIFGLLFLFFPLSIVAIVFGHISLSQIKKSAGRLGGKGLAIAGLCWDISGSP